LDGRWDLLVLESVPVRASRERIRAGLSFLRYAALAGSTWLAPRESGEIAALPALEKVRGAVLREAPGRGQL